MANALQSGLTLNSRRPSCHSALLNCREHLFNPDDYIFFAWINQFFFMWSSQKEHVVFKFCSKFKVSALEVDPNLRDPSDSFDATHIHPKPQL